MSPIASAGGGDAKRNIVAADSSTTERRMAPPMESGMRQPIEPTDIMSQPIPKQKRFKIDGQSERLGATNASDEPIRSFSHAATTSTTAMQQYINVLDKHGHSTASSLGQANLFFQLGSNTFLSPARLTKRCISSKDCIKGRTYMDSTSFSCAMKKNECPLVAYSENGIKYKRGYLLYLGVRETIIIGLKPDDSLKSTVTKFKPIDSHKSLSILYINMVDETMDSKVDGFLCSKTSGPDSIHISKIPVDLKMYKKLDPTTDILKIPTQLINVKQLSIPTPFNLNALTKKKNHVARVGMTCSIAPTSDQSVSDELWKGHMAIMSPDDEGTAYFLTKDDAEKLIDKEEMDRNEFLNELKIKSKYRIECNVLEVDKRDGLTLTMADSNSEDVGVSSKCSPCQQNYKYKGDIAAQYSIQKKIEVVDARALIFLVHHVLNGTSTSRHCSQSIGTFFNKGITTSDRPRTDPRKDEETKNLSERWTGSSMNQTFAPLFFELIEKLARFSNEMARAFDPVIYFAFSKVYESIITSESGKELIRSNLDPGMNLSSIQIFTCSDRSGVGFANSGHIDSNDANEKVFNKAMGQMLEKEISACCEESTTSSIDKRKFDNYLDALLYLLRLGQTFEVNEEHDERKELSYESETTCGYQPIYAGKEKRKVFCGFLYPKNNTFVKFREGEVTFQRWKSKSIFHQTPISFSFDEERVYLKDKDLIVLAWGSGTSNKRRDFLSESGINHGPTITGTTQLCHILRNGGAGRRAFRAARDRFPHNQKCIEDFFQTHYDEEL
mmetsp:Transcript_17282/g.34532  ORF Transcript_17282/g.34532 Transcript_17282/m.34532 type:complete len:782 (-) Transcript_17282:118-2463(-)